MILIFFFWIFSQKRLFPVLHFLSFVSVYYCSRGGSVSILPWFVANPPILTLVIWYTDIQSMRLGGFWTKHFTCLGFQTCFCWGGWMFWCISTPLSQWLMTAKWKDVQESLFRKDSRTHVWYRKSGFLPPPPTSSIFMHNILSGNYFCDWNCILLF